MHISDARYPQRLSTASPPRNDAGCLMTPFAFDTSSTVCLRSPLSTLPAGIIVPAFPQRSPPRRLIAAACGGLGSAPDCRTRRTFLHLSYSYAPPFGPAMLVSHDPHRNCAIYRPANTTLGSSLRTGRALMAAATALTIRTVALPN